MTDILAWFNPTRWLILLCLTAALGVGYEAWKVHQQHIGRDAEAKVWEAAMAKLKEKTRAELDAETAKTRAAQGALDAARAARENADATNAKTVSSLRAELRGVRLRDPGAGRGGGSCSPEGAATPGAVSGPNDRAEGSGLLSESFTVLLLDWAEVADRINLAYTSCRADALTVRETNRR